MADLDARTAFMSAARLISSVVGSAEVARHWADPSTLPGLSVGGLAGHAYLAARLVLRHLDQPEPVGDRVRRPGEYYWTMRVDEAAQLEDEPHRRIRADGEYVARRGAAALVSKFAELVDRLDQRLVRERPDRLLATGPQGAAARLDDFLANRTVELLVHADDLAASTELPCIEPPADSAGLAISSLVAVARERLGDRAVLQALSGRDRQLLEQLRVL
jgi:hypothetical protein